MALLGTETGTAAIQRRSADAWIDDPEVQLMQQVREGDLEAFGHLQKLYRPRILGFFFRQIRNRAEAEDLAQEVFLRLFRARQRYRPRASFATWIFHIAHNVARNAQRSKRRKPVVPLVASHLRGQLASGGLCEKTEPPSLSLERTEAVAVVRAAISSLVGRHRRALELHQFQHRTYAEVAAELSVSPKAAKSLLYRARLQLRDLLLPFMS
ncbi:MAG: RNA polymerase sigma factor [Gemmataceae bacterium]